MAITPAPGYQIDPNNPNAVIPIGGYGGLLGQSSGNPSQSAQVSSTPAPSLVNPNASGVTSPAIQPTPVQPQPQPQPVVPQPTQQTPVQVNVNNQPTPQPEASQTTSEGTSSGTSAPQSLGNLSPGMQGQNVAELQNYLVQMGYLTPEQVQTGNGTYDPQTTAAVAKLQQDLGINPGTGKGYFGPQTQQALAQKYQGMMSTTSGVAPANAADARVALGADNSQGATDPVFGSMASMMEPIMNSLSQVLTNINNPALTGISLQQEYNDLASKNNLPALQSQMLNMQNIMNGTESDIRDEVSKTGGFVTDSQVLGIAAARNKVILKQYNAVSTQYQAAATNVQNMMQYASQDQQTALQRQQMTASVTESMASISTQMMQMGMTMMNNTRSSLQSTVGNIGYKGLAASAQNNPQMLNYYEKILGLAPGALSNPSTLSQMDTYKDQQLQLNNYKAAITAFQAGYGGAGNPGYGGGPLPLSNGQVGTSPIDPTTLIRPSYVDKNVPLSMSADMMEQYMNNQKAAKVDPGTNNVVAPGVGYYVHQSDGSYVLKSALPTGIDQQYNQIKQTISSAGQFSGSPTVTRKWTLSANAAISSFKDTGTYKIASNVAPYLAAIHAAAVNPGDKAISDFELLDSFVKAAKGGTGQVTDSQINVMLNGASINDRWNILEQKLQDGGVLAPAQRQAIISLADETYKRNLEDYQKGYVQAVQNMHNQGIPAQFWGNLPDFSSLEPIQ